VRRWRCWHRAWRRAVPAFKICADVRRWCCLSIRI
jgi:hypothetical protein